MIYLVDTENIGTQWLDFVAKVEAGDTFVFFYTSNSMAYTMDALAKLTSKRVMIDFVKCETGHNSLDFHLIADLGLRIAEAPEEAYIIISRDTGFDSAVEYMRSKGFSVKRDSPVMRHAYFSKIRGMLPSRYHDDDCDVIAGIMKQAEAYPRTGKLNRKNYLHTALMRVCNTASVATELYHTLRPYIE